MDSIGGYGQRSLFDGMTEFNAHRFLIRQMMAKARTCLFVQVVAVYPGGVGPAGLVDVVELVNAIDGIGNPTTHVPVFGIPYLRIQGGRNAIICDPAAGDIGAAIVCDRDISSAKTNLAPSNPGSWRRFSPSDGLYLGGFLNAEPAQYVEFVTDGGINVVDKFENTIATSGAGISLTDTNGNTLVMNSSGIVVNGTTFEQGGTTTYDTHDHTYNPGSGSPTQTSPPVPGS